MFTFLTATIDLVGQAKDQKLQFVNSIDPNDTSGFGDFISLILQFIMVLAFLMVFIFLIWGGIEWITSGGDKGKLETARNKMTQAIIGLLVLAGSLSVYFLIQKIFGVNVLQQK